MSAVDVSYSQARVVRQLAALIIAVSLTAACNPSQFLYPRAKVDCRTHYTVGGDYGDHCGNTRAA